MRRCSIHVKIKLYTELGGTVFDGGRGDGKK